MPVVKVLLDSKGKILGTAHDVAKPADDAPSAVLMAGPGQQVVEVNLSAAEARMDAKGLHTALARKKLGSPSRGKPSNSGRRR